MIGRFNPIESGIGLEELKARSDDKVTVYLEDLELAAANLEGIDEESESQVYARSIIEWMIAQAKEGMSNPDSAWSQNNR